MRNIFISINNDDNDDVNEDNDFFSWYAQLTKGV